MRVLMEEIITFAIDFWIRPAWGEVIVSPDEQVISIFHGNPAGAIVGDDGVEYAPAAIREMTRNEVKKFGIELERMLLVVCYPYQIRMLYGQTLAQEQIDIVGDWDVETVAPIDWGERLLIVKPAHE